MRRTTSLKDYRVEDGNIDVVIELSKKTNRSRYGRRGRLTWGRQKKPSQPMFRQHTDRLDSVLFLAGGLGFEPRLEESESSVLPLNDPPMLPCPSSFVLTKVGWFTA